MNKNIIKISILIFIFSLTIVNYANADELNEQVKGKILLQVESKGEAWYVNPDNLNRYYLGRPADAFNVMRELGLGISNKDFNSYNNIAPKRLSGKILIKVEDNGEAYYVNPGDLKMYYLSRPADAFQIMRKLGLGITNENLGKISIYGFSQYDESNNINGVTAQLQGNGNFSYQERIIRSYDEWRDLIEPKQSLYSNIDLKRLFDITKKLKYDPITNFSFGSFFLDECKRKSPTLLNPVIKKESEFRFNYIDRQFTYKIDIVEDFYNYSKELKDQDCYGNDVDRYLKDPTNNRLLKVISDDFMSLKNSGYTNNEIVEIASVFAQKIPYFSEILSNRFSYETMYEEGGNCLDKSIILAGILKYMDYTPYIITTEEHAIVGIVCQDGNIEYNGQQICFIETTSMMAIASELDLSEIEDYIKVADGNLVYSEGHYGSKLAIDIEAQTLDVEIVENQIETINKKVNTKLSEFYTIQDQMCTTNCVVCTSLSEGGYNMKDVLNCSDAVLYNQYISNYNEKSDEINSYYNDLENLLDETYYPLIYSMEKKYFNNIDIIEKYYF